jgi:hypothetical protein
MAQGQLSDILLPGPTECEADAALRRLLEAADAGQIDADPTGTAEGAMEVANGNVADVVGVEVKPVFQVGRSSTVQSPLFLRSSSCFACWRMMPSVMGPLRKALRSMQVSSGTSEKSTML